MKNVKITFQRATSNDHDESYTLSVKDETGFAKTLTEFLTDVQKADGHISVETVQYDSGEMSDLLIKLCGSKETLKSVFMKHALEFHRYSSDTGGQK